MARLNILEHLKPLTVWHLQNQGVCQEVENMDTEEVALKIETDQSDTVITLCYYTPQGNRTSE